MDAIYIEEGQELVLKHLRVFPEGMDESLDEPMKMGGGCGECAGEGGDPCGSDQVCTTDQREPELEQVEIGQSIVTIL